MNYLSCLTTCIALVFVKVELVQNFDTDPFASTFDYEIDSEENDDFGFAVESIFKSIPRNASSVLEDDEEDEAFPQVVLDGLYYYFENNLQRNWWEAEEDCRNKGLTLVSIQSERQHANLVSEMHRQGITSRSGYFTSGISAAHDGHFTWASLMEPVDLFYWRRGDPRAAPDVHGPRCLAYKFRHDEVKWNDVSCHASFHYVCEIAEICDL